uniref:hypothetical protein n=1 Tax=Nocardia asiatica TaxID=209252 RepID=UPI0024549674
GDLERAVVPFEDASQPVRITGCDRLDELAVPLGPTAPRPTPLERLPGEALRRAASSSGVFQNMRAESGLGGAYRNWHGIVG